MGDNDFPVTGNPNLGFLQQYIRGFEDYSQKGTDIPSLRMQDKYAQESGSPLIEKALISGKPSFDISPDFDSPAVDRWIKEMRSQPGFQPTKFLSPQEMRRRVLELDKQMRGMGA